MARQRNGKTPHIMGKDKAETAANLKRFVALCKETGFRISEIAPKYNLDPDIDDERRMISALKQEAHQVLKENMDKFPEPAQKSAQEFINTRLKRKGGGGSVVEMDDTDLVDVFA